VWNRLRVEIDVSDLTELTYFIDKKCGELQEKVRKNPAFAEYVVKRQHFDEDWELDPFVIQDTERNDLVSLDVLEVEVLNESELHAFIDVQVNREQYDYAGTTLAFILVLILAGPFAGLFSISVVVGWLNPYNITIALLSDIILVASVARFYSKRKHAITIRQRIDVVAAREGLCFLSAMRKLASLSELYEWKRKEYEDRLKYIEEALSGSSP